MIGPSETSLDALGNLGNYHLNLALERSNYPSRYRSQVFRGQAQPRLRSDQWVALEVRWYQ